MLAFLPSVVATPPGTGFCTSPVTQPSCYGLGEYAVGTPVTHTKCPQLNLTSPTGAPTGVVSRKCIVGGVVTEGAACFSVKESVWEPKVISGIGLNGYWTDFKTTADSELYGWLDGVLPDVAPKINTPGNETIVIGQAVLCRDKTITAPATFPANITVACAAATNPNGCWMQGQIVGQSYDPNTWVCKLDDTSRALIPHTTHADIRPLCFAKSGDHAFAEAKGMQGFDPNWRDHYGDYEIEAPLKSNSGSCDCRDPACPMCCPFCEIAIPQAGYKCPTAIGLNHNILHYDVAAASHLYTPGSVTGVFFTDSTYTKLDIMVDGKNVKPQWGPQPGSTDYLIPRIPVATEITPNSFGQYVLCPSAAGATTYKGGKIFNTPMQSADKTYHIYGCDNEGFNATKSLKCQPADMLGLCYPTVL